MFEIQISNPSVSEIRNENDKNLDEAIESIFPLLNEYAFLIWNHIYIPLSYKYDISVMIKDIAFLIKELSEKEEGILEINWPSNTFSASWTIKFTLSEVSIAATWNYVLGNLTDLLNNTRGIEIPRQEFIDKWMELLSFIKAKLEAAGYNSTNLVDFFELEHLVQRYSLDK